MSNDVKFSTGAKSAIGVIGSVKGTLDGGFLKIYAASAVPATADAALVGATRLATYTAGGDGATGLTFADAATGGIVVKEPTETWTSGADETESGTALFWRWEMTGDDGSASTSAVRVQGECALGGKSMTLNSLAFVADTPRTLNHFSIPIYGSGE